MGSSMAATSASLSGSAASKRMRRTASVDLRPDPVRAGAALKKTIEEEDFRKKKTTFEEEDFR